MSNTEKVESHGYSMTYQGYLVTDKELCKQRLTRLKNEMILAHGDKQLGEDEFVDVVLTDSEMMIGKPCKLVIKFKVIKANHEAT